LRIKNNSNFFKVLKIQLLITLSVVITWFCYRSEEFKNINGVFGTIVIVALYFIVPVVISIVSIWQIKAKYVNWGGTIFLAINGVFYGILYPLGIFRFENHSFFSGHRFDFLIPIFTSILYFVMQLIIYLLIKVIRCLKN
jgi:hypothetical protein